jgi:hypothetical protein
MLGSNPGLFNSQTFSPLFAILGKDGEDEEHVSILLELVSRSVQRTEQGSTPVAIHYKNLAIHFVKFSGFE